MTESGAHDPSYRLGASVTVRSEEALRALLERPLDFGCRPSIVRIDQGGFRVEVIATGAQLGEHMDAGYDVIAQSAPAERAEVGVGDRFAGGIVPRGFGRKEPGR